MRIYRYLFATLPLQQGLQLPIATHFQSHAPKKTTPTTPTQQNQQNLTPQIQIYKKKPKKIIKQQSLIPMHNENSQKRHKSQFHKGMTLEQYFRSMEVNEDTIPTADSAVGKSYDEEESLYKTSHVFYNHGRNGNPGSIREISEENFQDSLDQYRDCINIVSTNLKPINKRDAVEVGLAEEPKKNYRIRNGKSVSPYHQNTTKMETKKTISPYKTFMKKFYVADQQHKACQQNSLKQSNKASMVRTLYGKQFQLRRSTKNIKIDPPLLPGPHPSPHLFQAHEKEHKYPQHPRMSIPNDGEMEKLDIRIETLKDRLQMKRKNKKG